MIKIQFFTALWLCDTCFRLRISYHRTKDLNGAYPCEACPSWASGYATCTVPFK